MDKMLYKTFGRRFNPSALTAARQSQNLSTAELTHLITGGDKRTDRVARYEAGDVKPSVPVLYSLVKQLKCSVDELAQRVPR